jgi:hypothetical protein
VREKLHVEYGRVPRAIRKIAQQFDLVMAGGLFDYLPRRAARSSLPTSHGNPYRPLIEYFGNWTLIERTEDEIVDYCVQAGVKRKAIHVTREATGLTLIIEIVT